MKKVYEYLRKLSETPNDDRALFLETLKMKNYGSGELSENEMWILSRAESDKEYLEYKLKEADQLSLDTEAPAETGDELSLDTPAEEAPTETGDELSLDTPAEEAPTETGDELSLDAPTEETPAETGEELSLDAPAETGDELSLDAPAEETPTETSEETEEESQPIETSKAGIGILSLIGEIQEKLANGKPSEVELAALKALKKLVG